MSKVRIRVNAPLGWNAEKITLAVIIACSYALFGLAAWLVLAR